MRDGGGLLVGYGMASAFYPVHTATTQASASIWVDGHGEARATVGTSAVDIGTGTRTVMAQIAADALGLPFECVAFELGDSALPEGSAAFGFKTVSSTGPAVKAACSAAVSKLARIAVADRRSPLHGLAAENLVARDGHLTSPGGDTGRRDSYADVLKRTGSGFVEAEGGHDSQEGAERLTSRIFGAQFAEVHVDEDLCRVRVERMLGIFGAGRIINPRTARSQAIGGMTFGLGMALMEETVVDRNSGHVVEPHLSGYHVPVMADVRSVEALFVDEKDAANPVGAKGVGEIGAVGSAAAIANAVYHATGKRIRELPITPEKLL